MRRSALLLGMVAAVALVAAACNSAASPSPAASADGGAGASEPLSGPELVGTAWELTDLPGVTLNDVRPTIAFSGDNTVEGEGGCNNYSGPYTVDGSNMTIGPLAAQQKACGDPADQVEQAYLAALDGVTAYEISASGELTLTSGSTTLKFAEQQ